MKIFALGDLHLSQSTDKPMDVFGAAWDNHLERIRDAWQGSVGAGDVVLVPGDISWAMRLEEAAADLDVLGALNGCKLILRGNHDYWWSSIGKVRAALPRSVHALQNDAFSVGGVCFAGTRGWVCPGSAGFSEQEDRRIYDRELLRLELSLKQTDGGVIIGMLHYPPFNEHRAQSGFTELFERYKVSRVVYGHLHDKACKNAFEGERGGIEYTLCSADHLQFAPKLIMEV